MHLWFLRGCFLALLIGMATGVLVFLENQSQNILGIVTFVAMMALGIAVVAIDLFVQNKQITTLSAVYFGLLLGLLLGSLFSMALDPFIKDIITGTLDKGTEKASEKAVETLRSTQMSPVLMWSLAAIFRATSSLLVWLLLR